jgi:CMP-N-acetylneuraminic acid synthetase
VSQRIAALVPMRHESERVPGKNYRPLLGRPLYQYVIESLLACDDIDAVVIDTDSSVIREDAAVRFPSVTVVDRPMHLRAGSIPMNDVLLNDVQRVDADLYLQTHSTNPLLRSATISAAIRALRADLSRDSLFSVTRLQTRLWSADGRPVNHDPSVLLRTQDLPPLYEENSCLYLFTRALLEGRGTRIGERPLLFEIDRDEAWDIDEEPDFNVAAALMEARQRA